MHLLYTPQTQLLISSCRARAVCANTHSLLTRRLGPSYHFDLGRSRHGWVFLKNNILPSLSSKYANEIPRKTLFKAALSVSGAYPKLKGISTTIFFRYTKSTPCTSRFISFYKEGVLKMLQMHMNGDS